MSERLTDDELDALEARLTSYDLSPLGVAVGAGLMPAETTLALVREVKAARSGERWWSCPDGDHYSLVPADQLDSAQDCWCEEAEHEWRECPCCESARESTCPQRPATCEGHWVRLVKEAPDA